MQEYDAWASMSLEMRQAGECLTEKQREAVTLHLLGYTQEEIGERLGVARTAIEGRLKRAFERIQKFLT